MQVTLSNPPRLRRIGARLALGAVLATSLLGIVAFRTLAARPGEDALRYVPANAILVASMDLSPSASQVLAFKHIDDALARNDMSKMLEGSVLDIFENAVPGKTALAELVQRHGAVALLPGPGTKGLDNPLPVAMVSLTSGQDALRILQKEGVARFHKGFRYFKLKNGKSLYTVIGDTLLVSEKPEALYAVHMTETGQTPSVTSVASFQNARNLVADDANLMVFVSPDMLSSGPKEINGMMSDWMTMGVALRDGGIGLSFGGAANVAKQPGLAKAGETAPVRSDLFRILPGGAYGAIVYSQPTKAFESIEQGVMTEPEMKKGMREMEDSMQKETGMSLRKDVLPAFEGTTVVAAYPTVSPTAGVDGLIVIDDSHGANPANAVERFTEWVGRNIEKEGNHEDVWTRREDNGVSYFRIVHKHEEEMQKSFSEGMKDLKPSAKMADKTIAWAIVGKAVLASTSQPLLERAVASYRLNADNLAGDAKFAPIESELLDGSQQLAMFSVSRIAEGVKNTIDDSKMDAEGRKTMNSILSAFINLDETFRVKVRMTPDGRFAGGTFVPMDYDKLIDFAGDMRKKSK